MIRILTFSTLFPNSIEPNHGIFVETRLNRLLDASPLIDSRVVAPVPWFPFSSKFFGSYAKLAMVPSHETRAGVTVEHPRYVIIPKIGMLTAPYTLYAASLPVLRRLQRERDFDLIDAHYLYPDGVAAVWLGRALGKPVVVTARGTDVNFIPQYRLPRRMIKEAALGADGIVAVSQAIKEAIVALDVPARAITVLRNGVNLSLFRPEGREDARKRLGIEGRVLLSVGHLVERKGHHIVIAALPDLPNCSLMIAGEGPEKAALHRLAAQLKVEDRVRFLGAVAHRELQPIYVAADALVLASSREGWPNVLLEAMACGTPVVASAIWGNPEVVASPAAGVLMRERSAGGVAEGVARLFHRLPSRSATRAYAEQFSWDDTSQGQAALFQRILASRRDARLHRSNESAI